MEKVLIYATAAQGTQEAAAYEEAINHVKKGDDVLFLHCSPILMGCHGENPGFHPGRCKACMWMFKRRAKKYLPEAVKIKSISDYWDDEIKQVVDSYIPKYSTIEEFRGLKYKNVSIGYGAMSSYISQTRNMKPELKDNIVLYLNKLLKSQVILTELINKALDDYNPDLVIFHNGRLAQYKPILNVCQHRKIHFIVTESFVNAHGVFMKNYFENTTPHDAAANTKKYEQFWAEYKGEDRDKVARSYYENKRLGAFTSEKVFTKDQVAGKMPDAWDKNKRHIVIYNSSEDEFCAINEEVDKAALFPSQIEGITQIVDHFSGKEDVQVYLRIHPNLKKITYSYHTDLYKIKADNFQIIPPDSDISSYTLMEGADIVIVFGSTMGIEAAYAGKPTICLAYAFYSLMNVVYVPKTVEELWTLADEINLKPLNQNGCLKYSLYYISDKHEKFDNLNVRYKNVRVLGHKFQLLSYLTIYKSCLLYDLTQRLLNRLFRRTIAV